MENVKINTEYIKLDQFLKWQGIADSGSYAKDLIISESIKVNGIIETRRGKKLYPGDIIEFEDQKFVIE